MKRKSFYFATLLFILLIMLCGCSGQHLQQQQIEDITRLPQTAFAYLDDKTADTLLIETPLQTHLANAFIEKHFSPWHCSEHLWSAEKAYWIVDTIRSRAVFAENLRPWRSDKLSQLIENATTRAVAVNDGFAITLRNSNLRALPTHKPCFYDPQLPGEGFPFDNFQNSIILANTPLKIRFVTTDGQWFFVESALAYGWLEATEVARVDENFMEQFETKTFITLIHDDVAIVDNNNHLQLKSRIGALLPIASSTSCVATTEQHYEIFIAVDGAEGQAQLRTARLSKNDGTTFPLKATSRNIATIAEQIVGEPYGWGGLFFNRDCSRTTRDIMTPFGLWLPRNSSKQAKIDEITSLTNCSKDEKEQIIRETATPFLSLLTMPGHVMLYVGQHEGQAIVLHTLWGLRTRSLWGKIGRKVIGSTVFTTLKPGDELSNLARPQGILLNRIEKIIQLGTLNQMILQQDERVE